MYILASETSRSRATRLRSPRDRLVASLARNKKYTPYIGQLEIDHKNNVTTVAKGTMTIQDGQYFCF